MACPRLHGFRDIHVSRGSSNTGYTSPKLGNIIMLQTSDESGNGDAPEYPQEVASYY